MQTTGDVLADLSEFLVVQVAITKGCSLFGDFGTTYLTELVLTFGNVGLPRSRWVS